MPIYDNRGRHVVALDPLAHATTHASGGTDPVSLNASQVSAGTFDNARINWASPGSIGATLAAAGAFTTLACSGVLSAAPDTDTDHVLGRVKLGAFSSDVACFSHIDCFNFGTFALVQDSAGTTNLNSAAGRNLYLTIDENNAITVNGTTRAVEVETTLYVNETVEASNFKRGTGDPEGVYIGVVGDLFTRTDGGVGSTLYVKESGTGNTGWAAK